VDTKHKFVLTLALGGLGIFFLGVVGISAARGFSSDVATRRIQAEADKARADAEMWQGRALAFQGEAEKWQGFALSAQSLTDPLGAFAQVLIAFAVVITAAGAGRILWGIGRAGEAHLGARTEFAKAQALLALEQKKLLLAPTFQTAYEREGFETRGQYLRAKHEVGVQEQEETDV